MLRVLLIVFMTSCLTPHNLAFGIDDPRDLIDHKNSKVRIPKQAPRIARVRIPIELTSFAKFNLRDQLGRMRVQFRPVKTKKHVLRARIETPNHFYVGDWHIETVPVAWSKKEKLLTLKVRFYKRYGNHKKLEEVVGDTQVKGLLEGEDFLYDFLGKKVVKFTNPLRHPVLTASIGKGASGKEMVKKDQGKQKSF